MNPEKSNPTPIEVTHETPDTYIVDTHKAAVMAHLEDRMRDDVADLEANAVRNDARAESSPDTFYKRTAEGYRRQAEAHGDSIDAMTDEVGQNYDDITQRADVIRARASESQTAYAQEHREQMEERLSAAFTKFGLIGSAHEPVPYLTVDRFAEEEDVKRANVHAFRSNNG